MKNFITACFETDGRWNRQKFWLLPLGFYALTVLPLGIIAWIWAYLAIDIIVQIAGLLVIVAYLALTYVSILSYIKRLRDLDKNPWMTILAFVPLANIYIFIICGFFTGTPGNNQYGSNPLETSSSDTNNTSDKKTIEL